MAKTIIYQTKTVDISKKVKKMKKSVDKELIVWYIINCQPKKGLAMNKMFFEN